MELKAKKYYFKCPDCNSNKNFHKVKEESSGFPWLLVLLGHVLLAGIFAAQHGERVQCASCGYIFKMSALPRSAVSKFALWIVFIVLISCGIAFYFFLFPCESIPELTIFSATEYFIQHNSKGVTISLLFMFLCLLSVCLITSLVSNFRLHRSIKEEYEITPKSCMMNHNENEIKEDKI